MVNRRLSLLLVSTARAAMNSLAFIAHYLVFHIAAASVWGVSAGLKPSARLSPLHARMYLIRCQAQRWPIFSSEFVRRVPAPGGS